MSGSWAGSLAHALISLISRDRALGLSRKRSSQHPPAGANGSASGAASGEPKTAGGDGAANLVLCVVNLDPYHRQAGWVSLPLDDWGIPDDRPFEVHDLLGGERYFWQGGGGYVELDPHTLPAHVFRVERRTHTERDFPTFA